MTTAPDKNVEHVRELLLTRSRVGQQKYGVTTERTDLNLADWVQHALEEACDLAVYLARIKAELEGPKKPPPSSPAAMPILSDFCPFELAAQKQQRPKEISANKIHWILESCRFLDFARADRINRRYREAG